MTWGGGDLLIKYYTGSLTPFNTVIFIKMSPLSYTSTKYQNNRISVILVQRRGNVGGGGGVGGHRKPSQAYSPTQISQNFLSVVCWPQANLFAILTVFRASVIDL